MSQDSEDFGPIIRANSKQKAEARGYKRAMKELKAGKVAPDVEPKPKADRGSLLKQLVGVVVCGFFGLCALAMFFQWQNMRQVSRFGGLIIGQQLSETLVDPTQYLISAVACALLTYGGWRLYKSGLPKKS